MKTPIKFHKIYLTIWLLPIMGCTEFVEIDLPPSQLTGKAVFADKATATAALANIYSGLRDQTLITGSAHGIGNLLGHYTDELDYYSSGIGYVYNFSNHSILSTDSEVANLWKQAFNLIYSCNSLLEGLEGNSFIAIPDREQLQGEALFLRSFIHFHLSQLFGEIPYVLGTDYSVNSKIGKFGVTEIHELLVSDIEKAISLLPEVYVVPGRIRINRYVAQTFLARIQLTAGNWEAALAACNEVLSKTDLYVWEENLDHVFLKESQGTLWQLKPASEGGNTLQALTFYFETGPPLANALSQSFIQSFSSNDQRVTHWTRSVTDGNAIWFHPNKYKAVGLTTTTLENSVVFRLAELYMIRAEARMRLNNFEGAMADLNKIRNRAGLSDLVGLSKPELEDAILQERKHEFFTEFGHRWFDLKRFHKAGEVLAPLKSNWKESNLLFPIPQSELLANPNLNPQNEGY